MPKRDILRVEIPGSTEYISCARHAVDSVCARLRMASDARAAVILAVGEACNNAVLHADEAGAGPDERVLIICRDGTGVLEIDVASRGDHYRPMARAEMPPGEALAEHGRGRALMELLMDSVEYRNEGGRLVVRMRKSGAAVPEVARKTASPRIRRRAANRFARSQSEAATPMAA